jgi:hypothetical protein
VEEEILCNKANLFQRRLMRRINIYVTALLLAITLLASTANAADFSGHLFTHDGHAFQNKEVILLHASEPLDQSTWKKVTTGKNGDFLFKNLNAGRYIFGVMMITKGGATQFVIYEDVILETRDVHTFFFMPIPF